MQIFIDSANVTEIERWLNYGVIDGVTTNASIMLKDGVYDMERGARDIARLVDPLPVSVQVTTNDLWGMIVEAKELSSWAPNIVVKIPVITEDGEPCLGVMRELSRQGIKVNATACLSFHQVVLAAKAGATYASIFGGRVADEGGDAPLLIRQAVEWLERYEYQAKLIVGSIRATADVQQAAVAGAHIITVPPQFLSKMVDHRYSRETVRQFVADAQKTGRMMEQLKAGQVA